MNTPIDPSMCDRIKAFVRPSLTAVLSKSHQRLGDLEFPLVVHVHSDGDQLPILTVACTRHAMQHDKQNCVIRVFDKDEEIQPAGPSKVTLMDFEQKALNIVRAQLGLGPPEQGGVAIWLLRALRMSSLLLSVIFTAAAVAFMTYQVWAHPADLLESKNPGMVAAWLLPGSGLFATAAWAKRKVAEIRAARL